MKPLRIYCDTSVIGGCFDREFAPWSLGLIDDFRAGRAIPLVSRVVAAEIYPAPEVVQALYAQLVSLAGSELPVTGEARELQHAYEAHRILSSKYQADMLHIALATVANADLLVSWNFKHIVRFDKIRLFNAVNLENGYGPIPIHSPREVTTHGRDEDQSG